MLKLNWARGCGFLAIRFRGMVGESRELLLQNCYGKIVCSDLILEKPNVTSQVKQVPFELCTLPVVNLFHLSQLLTKIS